ncbi:MAG: hypothetical protein COW84_10690 [Gammaproteobacteria bacterium CG22_combo_CG10-13_8_21_14_all_40_8]|nr:MAG: hypothetical protein COW84_10690 [Gammaproteobacteria bacterium CG22_combo_CG10-13_8_21_14_all_40_8]
MSQLKVIRARDIMKKAYIEVDGMMTVEEALNALKQQNSNVIIVKKRHVDDAFGLVLLSDIAHQVLAKDRSPDRVNLYEVMTKPVVHLPPDMDVRYCARFFERLNLSVAPVIENDLIVGIVSYGELVLRGLYKLYQLEDEGE